MDRKTIRQDGRFFKNQKGAAIISGGIPGSQKDDQDHFSIELNYNGTTCTKAQYQIGYYPLLTDNSACYFSIEDAMLAHKNQYKMEHFYKRSTSGYNLEPIYLQTPDRINA